MDGIKNILYKFNFTGWSGILLAEKIINNHSSQVKNAIKNHDIPTSEQILFLHDNTTWNTGKDSILFTTKRLSICKTKIIGRNDLFSFDWTSIKRVEILNGHLIVHQKGLSSKVDIPLKDVLGSNHNNSKQFIELVNQIISLDHSEFTGQSRKTIMKILYIFLILFAIGSFIKSKLNLPQSAATSVQNTINEIEIQKSISLGKVENIELSDKIEPIYFALPEGDSVKINAEFNYPASLHLFNYKEKKELLSFKNVKRINHSVIIPNTDIYYMTIETDEGNYASISVDRIFNTSNSKNYNYEVGIDSVIKPHPFSGSEPSTKYIFTSVFKNPHKATVNSQGKKLAGFGENRVIIPVNLPNNTTEWIYRLTLSYRDKSTETTLYNDMNTTWNKVNKSMAIATAFANPSSGLLIGRPIILQNQAYKMLAVGQAVDLVTLLYDKLKEVPKEEASLNFFLITGEPNTKNFLNGTNFEYNIASSSQRNIHSTEEYEKKVISGQIYLGLENTNITEPVFVQLEVIAIEKTPLHMRLDRKLIKKSVLLMEKEITISDSLKAAKASKKKDCAQLKIKLEGEQGKLEDIMEWQFGRTEQEKREQIAKQELVILEIKSRLEDCE